MGKPWNTVMTTLFLLIAALSAVPFSTLNEKHINYVAEKDLGKGNTRNNIGDANGTANCSTEKTSKNDSANWTAGKNNDLSEGHGAVCNKSRGNEETKTINEKLIVGNGKFYMNLSDVPREERNRHTLPAESKLLFILFHATLAVFPTFVCILKAIMQIDSWL